MEITKHMQEHYPTSQEKESQAYVAGMAMEVASRRSRSCSELAIALNYFIPDIVTGADAMSDMGRGDEADPPRGAGGQPGPPLIFSRLGWAGQAPWGAGPPMRT